VGNRKTPKETPRRTIIREDLTCHKKTTKTLVTPSKAESIGFPWCPPKNIYISDTRGDNGKLQLKVAEFTQITC